MNLYHREEVSARKGRRLKRKKYWTVGVNDVWTIDQHDKWRKFQLFLHVGIEPHSGLILWLKIWWTNSDPRVILSYYLDFIAEAGCKYLPEQIFSKAYTLKSFQICL